MKKAVNILALVMLFLPVLFFSGTVVSAADRPVTAKIPVQCVGKNTSESFSYVMDMESTEFQNDCVTMLRLKNGETGSFSVTYTIPGTYHYTIRQNAGVDDDTVYDDTIYTVDVYVTEDESGILSAQPVLYVKGNTEKKASASFTNEKKSRSTTSAGHVDSGDRTETGRDMLLTAVFLSAGILLAKKRGDLNAEL